MEPIRHGKNREGPSQFGKLNKASCDIDLVQLHVNQKDHIMHHAADEMDRPKVPIYMRHYK